ncbi:gamma-glutamylcyclotransferase family protein [Haloarchaeobius salinus]|uniref:gamma-glutamylcyclotransferase family protein n=1 Tax=Haloarchaeobius salinus TaxID=1198298 RepID=UPI00210D0017|nr:gamma-glutamylcyclotransferase family protein [Haloarchaeobius salinus]
MDVFVYGTLTDPDRVAELLDDWSFGPDAVLRGAHRVDGRYPTLAPGGETAGRILHTTEIAALDRYEGVESGLYRRVTVPREADAGDGEPVQMYVGDPAELAVVDAAADWPDGPPTLDALAELVSAEGVVVPTLE